MNLCRTSSYVPRAARRANPAAAAAPAVRVSVRRPQKAPRAVVVPASPPTRAARLAGLAWLVAVSYDRLTRSQRPDAVAVALRCDRHVRAAADRLIALGGAL
jgi:hypothetical protein